MSASSYRINGASFTKTVARLPPRVDDAIALHLFGVDASHSLLNYVDENLAGTLAGTPTYGSAYAAVSSANGFVTNATCNSPFTHCVIAQPVMSQSHGFAGAWGGGVTRNMLYFDLTQIKLGVDSSNRCTSASFTPAGYTFMAGSHDGTTAKVHRGQAGAIVTVSAAYAGGSSSSTLRYGGHGYGSAAANIAASMSFNAALSDAEVLDVYDYLRGLVAARGITTV